MDLCNFYGLLNIVVLDNLPLVIESTILAKYVLLANPCSEMVFQGEWVYSVTGQCLGPIIEALSLKCDLVSGGGTLQVLVNDIIDYSWAADGTYLNGIDHMTSLCLDAHIAEIDALASVMDSSCSPPALDWPMESPSSSSDIYVEYLAGLDNPWSSASREAICLTLKSLRALNLMCPEHVGVPSYKTWDKVIWRLQAFGLTRSSFTVKTD